MEAKIWNKKFWINKTNPEELKELIEGLLNESGFGIMKFNESYFDPIGYTAFWIITESHCAIHTFPEKNKSYIELSSCNKEKHNYFIKKLTKLTKNGL